MRIVIRRDDSVAWADNGDVVTLLSGEQGYEVNTGKLKIGDGLEVWNNLPYFAGGITDYDNLTLITDASGVLMLNEESVIGNLGNATTVQEYVDLKDSALVTQILAEEAARELGDSILSDRIDALTVASEEADTALAAELGDSIAALEERSASSDSALQLSIAFNQSSINGLDTQITNNKNESQSADDAIHLRIDSVDAKFGSLTAPGQAASDNVTDFVGLVTGNLGGVNVKTYSDAGDSVLGSQISALEAADTVLGGQINALVAADTVEAAARVAGDDSVAAMLGASVTALEAADDAIELLIADKADQATTFTKDEVNTALGEKADASTTFTKDEVNTALALKADQENATLTGAPTAPTSDLTDNSTRIATTNFVVGKISDLSLGTASQFNAGNFVGLAELQAIANSSSSYADFVAALGALQNPRV